MTQVDDEKPAPSAAPCERLPEEEEEIKEFHFHVYFFQNNEENRKSAEELREKILKLVDKGFFHIVPLWRINQQPIGPHTIGSYEVWAPKEHFSRAYSWFLLHRGVHSVLIHPLTREARRDHHERAAWLGTPVPLDLSQLPVFTIELPLQYPELKLGYSAPNE
ncbi:DOPA-like domain-containing protein [Jimgerdemannia flammicorona]|uniref:DOPA-like domain-containing protein n=1 Tax=Jimgerdemannia flammicorona TaxID=994334 RepID=A0A433QHI8_9FUNG|nr:DOPA-like domain-containing protein [Jimgerdemannia flammicorona]